MFMLQFGDVNMYVRICHHRDAKHLAAVTYSPAELGRYRALLTAAVTLTHTLHSIIDCRLSSDVHL